MGGRLLDAIGALRTITGTNVRHTLLFGLVAATIEILIHIAPIMQFLQIYPPVLYVGGFVVGVELRALVLLAAIVVADRAVDRGATPRRIYPIAAFAGCVAGAALGFAFDWAWRHAIVGDIVPMSRAYTRSALFGFLYFQVQWLLFGGTAVLLYAARRIARRAEGHLRAAELERVRQSKRALESRLQAMQARVEPRFLFDTLAQVERLYRSDAERASRLMSELIAYLRTAMPLMRGTTSTVAREVALVRNYLDIARHRLDNRLRVDIDLAAQAADARMPPMMLLPLVDHAIDHGAGRPGEGSAIGIRVSVDNGQVRVAVVDSDGGFASGDDGDAIGNIRERLSTLFGSAGSLDLRHKGAAGSEAVLQIPYEPADAAGEAAPAP